MCRRLVTMAEGPLKVAESGQQSLGVSGLKGDPGVGRSAALGRRVVVRGPLVPTASDATCDPKRCAPGLYDWYPMLHRPGIMAMTRPAASRPTPVRRSARTMKKSRIEMPPGSVGAVITNPPRAPATVMSHARCSESIPARNRSSRRLLNVPSIGKVPICLRQVVPVQLTEVLQDSAMRTVERDELNRLGWRAQWKSQRVCGHRKSLSRCAARPS